MIASSRLVVWDLTAILVKFWHKLDFDNSNLVSLPNSAVQLLVEQFHIELHDFDGPAVWTHDFSLFLPVVHFELVSMLHVVLFFPCKAKCGTGCLHRQ